jgi:hypothetical protein
MGICADGDVRDLISVRTADDQQLVLISKNSDRLQVIKPTVKGKHIAENKALKK